jgi:hypothetical protein
LVVGVREQLNHVAGPSLALLLQEEGKLAQVVLVAQGVLARQRFVGQPSVPYVDGHTRVAPSMAQGEVLERLGRPSDIQGLRRSRGVVWSYRYENPFCQWLQVEISQEQLVRSASYGEPPKCSKRDDIIVP